MLGTCFGTLKVSRLQWGLTYNKRSPKHVEGGCPATPTCTCMASLLSPRGHTIWREWCATKLSACIIERTTHNSWPVTV
eukprot:scaffold293294_cov21-Tisochrysis_lutea.AAC.3